MNNYFKTGFVDNDDEYTISKSLLETYLTSNAFNYIIDGNWRLVNDVIGLCNKNLFDIEKELCFNFRKDLRYLNIASNYGHKGTNTIFKLSGISVHTQMYMMESVEIMCQQNAKPQRSDMELCSSQKTPVFLPSSLVENYLNL